MKYLSLLSLFFIYPIVGFAQNNDSFSPCEPFQSGFYSGVRVGPSFLHSKSRLFSEFLPDPETTPFHQNISSSFGSIGLQFGYLYRFNCSPLILAPEAFFSYNPSSINQQVQGEPYSHKLKTNFSFGANVRFGTLLTDNLFLYGFIGVTSSHFRFEVNENAINEKITNQTKYTPALTYGVGLEHELKNTHRIRIDAGCSDYKRINFSALSYDRFHLFTATIKPKVYSINFMYSIPF